MRFSTMYGYVVLTAMTTVYCILIWYSGNLVAIFLPEEPANLPLVSILCIKPLPFLPLWWGMIHWQLLAAISLLLSIRMGMKRSSIPGNAGGHCLPIVLHTTWIVFSISCNMLGAIMPMVSIGHVIN